MRSSLLWIVPVAMVCTQALAEAAPKLEKETRTMKITASAGQPLTVSTRNGAVAVTRGNTDQMIITAEVFAKTKEDLAKIEISMASDSDKGSSVEVEFPDPNRVSDMGCSLKIELPRANGVMIETTNGPIQVSEMAGKAVLETTNGPVMISDQDGEVIVETMNAPVQAKDVKGTVTIKTSNGPVELSLHKDVSESFEIESSNAPVEVWMPRSFEGVLSAQTSNGNISFPADAGLTKKPANRGYGTASGQATFGKGGAASSIETSNGPVTIRYRDEATGTPNQKKPAAH
ncbi:MAG TPA: DUF4097 family beta strand repeat-containing protein [Phycisphaerales bacterium]